MWTIEYFDPGMRGWVFMDETHFPEKVIDAAVWEARRTGNFQISKSDFRATRPHVTRWFA